MARLSKTHIHAALDRAAKHILDARGDDYVVSRRDIRAKLRELSGNERALTDMLYRFIDKRDYKPGARITKTDVDDTLAYAKEKLIDAYDTNNNGFSRTEIDQLSTTGKLAVAFARELLAQTDKSAMLDQLRELGEGLYFIGYGSEHDPRLRFFHQPADLTNLTREALVQALNLQPADPDRSMLVFEQGYQEYGRMFEDYEYYEAWEDLSKMRRLHNFMVANLRDITHTIVSNNGSMPEAHYPTYFIGLTPDGDIAGFVTEMVWT